MKKFIVIYHTTKEAAEQMANTSQEDQSKGMEGWMIWAKKCGDKLVDMGTPLTSGQHLSHNGGSTASATTVGGYSILQAADMAEAKSLLQGHPHLAWNADCSIDVYESMPIPGM